MGASPLNVALRDLTIAHAHNVAYFEREALELFIDAAVARGGAYLAGRKRITIKVARAAAKTAAVAGFQRLRRLLVDVALLPFRTIEPRLAVAVTGKLRERREVEPPVPSAVTIGMTRADASALVGETFAHPPPGLAALDIERGLSRALQRSVSTALVQGIAPRELARGLRDILGDTRNYETYVRTAVQSVNNAALSRMYQKNRKLLRGVEYMAQLDSRTCVACAGYDGRKYWMEPAKGQAGYTGRPGLPQHANCRCLYSPISKSLKELGIKGTAKAERYLSGGPAQRTTYAKWLARQSAETRRKILGPNRMALYDKGVPIDKFSRGGRTLPIEDLRGIQTSEIAVRNVVVPKTTATASKLATDGLRAGQVRDVAQRAHVFTMGHGMEAVGPGAKAAVNQALAGLPEVARKTAHVRTVAKVRYAKVAGKVGDKTVQTVQVRGLSPSQLETVARQVGDSMPTVDLRVRGADMGWSKRLLRIRQARGGYVEELTGTAGRGRFRIQHLHREP